MQTHSWNCLFPLDFASVLRKLQDIVQDLYRLGVSLSLPRHLLDAVETDFPHSTERRRTKLVRVWMSSSPDPPCWWHLVQALKQMDYRVLAKEIETEQSKFWGIGWQCISCVRTCVCACDLQWPFQSRIFMGREWPWISFTIYGHMYQQLFSTSRCLHSTAEDSIGPREAEPETRWAVPGVACWCGQVRVSISGLHPLPHQHWDGGGGGKAPLSFRTLPPDAQEVGHKGRCHKWPVVPQTDGNFVLLYYPFLILKHNFPILHICFVSLQVFHFLLRFVSLQFSILSTYIWKDGALV